MKPTRTVRSTLGGGAGSLEGPLRGAQALVLGFATVLGLLGGPAQGQQGGAAGARTTEVAETPRPARRGSSGPPAARGRPTPQSGPAAGRSLPTGSGPEPGAAGPRPTDPGPADRRPSSLAGVRRLHTELAVGGLGIAPTESGTVGLGLAEFRAADADGNGLLDRDEFVVGYHRRLVVAGGTPASDLATEARRLETVAGARRLRARRAAPDPGPVPGEPSVRPEANEVRPFDRGGGTGGAPSEPFVPTGFLPSRSRSDAGPTPGASNPSRGRSNLRGPASRLLVSPARSPAARATSPAGRVPTEPADVDRPRSGPDRSGAGPSTRRAPDSDSRPTRSAPPPKSPPEKERGAPTERAPRPPAAGRGAAPVHGAVPPGR